MFEAIATGCLPVVLAPLEPLSKTVPFPSLVDYDEFGLFAPAFDFLTTRSEGVARLAKAIEKIVGPGAGSEYQRKAERMRQRGMEVFKQHFSYFRNPQGVASSMLLEAWVLMQKMGVIDGPFAEQKPV